MPNNHNTGCFFSFVLSIIPYPFKHIHLFFGIFYFFNPVIHLFLSNHSLFSFADPDFSFRIPVPVSVFHFQTHSRPDQLTRFLLFGLNQRTGFLPVRLSDLSNWFPICFRTILPIFFSESIPITSIHDSAFPFTAEILPRIFYFPIDTSHK